jgi:Fe2+ transport protein
MRWHLLGRIIIPLGLFVGAGCASNPAAGPAAQTTATTAQAAAGTVTPAQAPAAVGAQASPVPAANIQVSPASVPVGNVTLSLAFEPARHMQDETRMVAGAAQPQVPAPQATPSGGPPSQGAIVLSDMLHVTNNLDPTQPAPVDSAQSIIRQAVVQVVASDTHQLVPYLNVTIDLLLDGHPVTYGQTLVPMLTNDGSGERVYYGNNVRLPERGTFQAFVRMDRTPILGQDTPPAAQFNLAVQ